VKILIHRPLWVLIAALAAALACWKQVPGTRADRSGFEFIAASVINPPWLVSGTGSHDEPWSLQTSVAKSSKKQIVSPVIIAIDDDPDGVFQNFPPSPIDVAVLLNNLHRLGEKNASIAAVFAWDEPDTIGLTALAKTIGRFESVTMAAPLSRGTTSEPMPSAFLRASIPMSEVIGDSSLLPVVNRIAVRSTILGRENTMAGFQSLDSQSENETAPLIARWDDRVVFAFPLVVAAQQLGLPIDGIKVHCGSSIALSPQGPILAIDAFGRPLSDASRTSAPVPIPATKLIDADASLLQRNPRAPLIVLDARSTADSATMRFSKQVPTMVSSIVSNAGTRQAFTCKRLDYPREISFLIIFALILSATSALATFPRNVMLLTIAGSLIAAQFIAASLATTWLPGLAALASVATAFIISSIIPEPKKP
jgi:hypothetical protein